MIFSLMAKRNILIFYMNNLIIKVYGKIIYDDHFFWDWDSHYFLSYRMSSMACQVHILLFFLDWLAYQGIQG